MVQALTPGALTQQRLFRGLSVEELALAVGVTPRAVRYWEAGARTVGDRTFGQLLKVLHCDAQDLTACERGTETLADLRRAAGMSAEQTASALRPKLEAHGLYVSAEKTRDLERGRRIRGWSWQTPETLGLVARILAQVYQVPERVVMDAWGRSRPTDPAPALPSRRAQQQPSKESMAAWCALNSRQRHFLSCIFHQDQDAEREQRQTHLQGSPRIPAREWRRMTLSLGAPAEIVGLTPLQERLREVGVHDQGVGSSITALQRRGLVLVYRDRIYIEGIGDVARTRVEMTRRGRTAARRALGIPRESNPPAPLLSPWLWRIMVRVARAGDRGVDGSLSGRGPHYLAVGQTPDARTPSRGFIVLRHPDGVTHGPYRWLLTDSGRRHMSGYLDTYRNLYSDIDTDGLEGILA